MARPTVMPPYIWDSLTEEARAVVRAVVFQLEGRLAEAERPFQQLRARLSRTRS
jgi:hypothetical protein